jgi:hypothetical protein
VSKGKYKITDSNLIFGGKNGEEFFQKRNQSPDLIKRSPMSCDSHVLGAQRRVERSGLPVVRRWARYSHSFSEAGAWYSEGKVREPEFLACMGP